MQESHHHHTKAKMKATQREREIQRREEKKTEPKETNLKLLTLIESTHRMFTITLHYGPDEYTYFRWIAHRSYIIQSISSAFLYDSLFGFSLKEEKKKLFKIVRFFCFVVVRVTCSCSSLFCYSFLFCSFYFLSPSQFYSPRCFVCNLSPAKRKKKINVRTEVQILNKTRVYIQKCTCNNEGNRTTNNNNNKIRKTIQPKSMPHKMRSNLLQT